MLRHKSKKLSMMLVLAFMLSILAGVNGTFAVVSTQQDIDFQPAMNFPVGDNPSGITTADFNNDGNPDLAVVNQGSSNVSVLLGDGTGNFGPATNFPGGGILGHITAADFNNDGNIDLAVTAFGFSSSLLLGDGTGNFVPGNNFTGGTGITSADFNNDGNVDLALAETNGDIFVLLGDGTGNFTVVPLIGVGGFGIGITAADFDNDGNADLAAVSFEEGTVVVLLGDGTGNFGPATKFGVGEFGPFAIISADFNNDGNPDLATANSGDLSQPRNNISVLLGEGDGTFGPATLFLVNNFLPQGITAADFNKDGNVDLATANVGLPDGGISVLLGNGNGTFEPAESFAAGIGPAGITTADFNLDGNPDLATANSGSDNVSVLLQEIYGNNTSQDNAPIQDNTPIQDNAPSQDNNASQGNNASSQPGYALTEDNLKVLVENNLDELVVALQTFAALTDQEAQFIINLGVEKPGPFRDLIDNPLKSKLTDDDIKTIMQAFQAFVNNPESMSSLRTDIQSTDQNTRLGAVLVLAWSVHQNIPPEFYASLNDRKITDQELIEGFFDVIRLTIDQLDKMANLDPALLDRLLNGNLTEAEKKDLLENKGIYWDDIYNWVHSLTDAEKAKIKTVINKSEEDETNDSGTGNNDDDGNNEDDGNNSGGSGGSGDSPITFTDITGHWAQADIELMYNKGYVKGIGDNLFAPEAFITRAEFATLLQRVMGLKVIEGDDKVFSDVDAGAWYYGTVNAAAYAKLANGYPDGTFKPNAQITREEMAALVVRAMAYGGKPVTLTTDEVEAKLVNYQDKDQIGAWAREAAAIAVDAGIVKGRSEDQWVPQANVTRAEGVVMLKRLLQSLGKL